MSEPFRFRPPSVRLRPEVRWLIGRAFGPPEQPFDGGGELDPKRILDAGARLDLLARIAGRTPERILRQECDDDLAATLEGWFEATAVQMACLRRVADDLVSAAGELDAPVVFLKGMAMNLLGMTPPGSRPMADVDVLTTRGAANALQQALIDSGYARTDRSPFDEEAHGHLWPLKSRHGHGTEIHFNLHDLACGEGERLTCDEVLSQGLTQPAPGLPDFCRVPRPDLLVAHLLVHGIATHGHVPGSYAAGRVVTDIADVGWHAAEWQEFLAGPHRWIEQVVSRREVEGISRLVQRLGDGVDPADVARAGDDPAAILNHLVAVVEWHQYDRLLTLRQRGNNGLWALLWPSPTTVAAALGEDAGTAARVGWRLQRPFRVVPTLTRVAAGQARAIIQHALRRV